MKARIMIFKFRFLAIIDVMFAERFELKTFDKSGWKKNDTKFWKQEILDNI